MRFVVYGAGAIGGVVGARLFQHGSDVLLIARGSHYDALQSRGLRIQDPAGEQGIETASTEEDAARRADLLHLSPVAGEARPGGSSWQSLARRAPGIETDHLNGEIVLLGRLHGIATPVNALLQRLANRLAATGGNPGSIRPDQFNRLLVSG